MGLSEVWLKGQKMKANAMKAQGRCGHPPMCNAFAQQFMQQQQMMMQQACMAGYAAMAQSAQNSMMLAQMNRQMAGCGAFAMPGACHNGMQMSAYYHAGLMRGRMQGLMAGGMC